LTAEERGKIQVEIDAKTAELAKFEQRFRQLYSELAGAKSSGNADLIKEAEDKIKEAGAEEAKLKKEISDLKKKLESGKAPTPPPPAKSSSGVSHEGDPFAMRMLKAHNAERAAFGAPPLEWSGVLAANAREFAGALARTGRLAHASRTGRGVERENINQGMLGWNVDQMLANWLRERANFVPGTFPNVSRTGRWDDIGHYSQMIWPTTEEVGCGLVPGSGFQWLVCRYSPGGNRDGETVGLPPPPDLVAVEPC
jgi:hypothetical protein